MLQSIKACSNRAVTEEDRTGIYLGANRYADCYFGIPYVDSGSLQLPLRSYSNDNVPSWVGKGDNWNGAAEDVCTVNPSSKVCD